MKYITKEEVMDLLKISLSTMDRIMKHNKIPYYKVDHRNRVLFEESKVIDWLEKYERNTDV